MGVWSAAMYCNAKFYRRRSRPRNEFSPLQAFVVQILFLDLITGEIRGGWVLSYLVGGDEERGVKRDQEQRKENERSTEEAAMRGEEP